MPSGSGPKSQEPRAKSQQPAGEKAMATNLLAHNEGTIDRVLRVVVGLIGISLVFFGPKTLFGLIGFLPLVTGLAGVCPLYSLIGVSTCGKQPAKQS
jgi:DUF2892 family protein